MEVFPSVELGNITERAFPIWLNPWLSYNKLST